MKIKVKKPVAIPFCDLEPGDVFVSDKSPGDCSYWMRIMTMDNDANAVNLSTGGTIEFLLDRSVIKIHGYFVVEQEDL